jgi:hypothetical protein
MMDARSAVFCFLLLAAGCASAPEQPPPGGVPPVAAVSGAPAPSQPPEISTAPAQSPAVPPMAEPAPDRTIAVPSPVPAERKKAQEADRDVGIAAREGSSTPGMIPPAPENVLPKPLAPKVVAPSAAIRPAAGAEQPAVAQTVPRKPAVAPAAETPRPPALDLKALETRLRETNAIGLMTKLTLKGQVEDLLERFRAYHEGRARIQLAELRQPYDSLILKVLALLQDRDPSLASAIASSREAIWSILTDREKFSKL